MDDYKTRLWGIAKADFESKVLPALKSVMGGDIEAICVGIGGSLAIDKADSLSDIDMFIGFSSDSLRLKYQPAILRELKSTSSGLVKGEVVQGFTFNGKGSLCIQTLNLDNILEKLLSIKDFNNQPTGCFHVVNLKWREKEIFDPSCVLKSMRNMLYRNMYRIFLPWVFSSIKSIDKRIDLLSEAVEKKDLLTWHIYLSDFLDTEVCILVYIAHFQPWPETHWKYEIMRDLSSYGREIFEKISIVVDSKESLDVRHCILWQVVKELSSIYTKGWFDFFKDNFSKESLEQFLNGRTTDPAPLSLDLILDWAWWPMQRMIRAASRNQCIENRILFGKSLRHLCYVLFYINKADFPPLNRLTKEIQKLPILGKSVYSGLKKTFKAEDWRKQHLVFNQVWKKVRRHLVKNDILSLNDVNLNRECGRSFPGSPCYDRFDPYQKIK